MNKIVTLSWPLVLACYYFGQPVGKVMSKSRKREFVTIRQIVQYMAYHSGMTYWEAGELTGSGFQVARCNVRRIAGMIEPMGNGKIQDRKLSEDVKILSK